MKDYKRLTDRDDDGIPYVKCADCYIRDKCDSTKEVCYQELQDRLAEIEDKIESGEIDYVTEWKRRTEVAEKALDLCETAYILSLNHRATEGISGQAIASDLGVHKFFIKQAEKELAEEGKE